MGFLQNSHGHHGGRHHSEVPRTVVQMQEPAYEGAKFDTSGHCLKHPTIRMCRPTATKKSSNENNSGHTEMKYVIVRKTCHRCGEHALWNERKLNKRSWAHGYDAAKLKTRKGLPKGMMIKSDAVHHSRSTTTAHRGSSGRSSTKRVLPCSSASSRKIRKVRTPDPTPHSSPESNRGNMGKELPVLKLVVDSASPPPPPPPLPGTGRGRLTGGRVRLQGVIPAGLHLDVRYSPLGIYKSHHSIISSDTSKDTSSSSETSSDHSSEHSSGSRRTERHSNVGKKSIKSTTRGSDHRSAEVPESILKILGQLHVS